MTNPPSHPQVSVEETENGYIVHAGSAVATISKTILGYAVDADSQILKEEYDLSPLVTNTRKSARDLAQLSNDTDDTRLIEVLSSDNSPEKEQILMTAVKYHLRTLGVENKLVHALSVFLLSRSCTKSKIYASFGAGYKMGDVTSCIDQLLLDGVIDVHQCRRFIGGNVLYYTMIDRQGFVSDLIHKKDEAIKVFSKCLENIIDVLNRDYSVTHSNYKLRTSSEYDTVSLLLIDPIISLGLTDEVTQILVYLHLFENASESDISQVILHSDSDEKFTDLLRYLRSINWITTNSVQKKVGHTYKITQFYSLAQSLEDILIDYVLSYAERLEKSSEELKLIVDHVETHPFINPEVYVVPINWDNAHTEIDNPPIYCDTKLQYVLSELEESITSRLIQYGYDVELARIILNLLLNRKVRTSELSPILQQDDNNAKDFIEDLINTKSIIVGKSGETTSETYYQLSISTLNFGYKILESFESEVRDAENSLDKISEIEKKFVNSSIEGWIKPQYLPEFNELSSILCSFGLDENTAKTLVLLSVKPVSRIQDIVAELTIDSNYDKLIETTLLQNEFIVGKKTGADTYYHLALSISEIVSSYISHIRVKYDIDSHEFISLIRDYDDCLKIVTRDKEMRKVFFTPFSHPLRSYTKITEQIYDLNMKTGFTDTRVCLVELRPTDNADILHASSLYQIDIDSDREILIYGYYKEYEQYIVWDFAPNYDLLKVRDLTVPKDIFDPVAGQDKVLLRTLPSGANIITCPVNKPYQAIKYWYEKKQEKEEEDSWFK